MRFACAGYDLRETEPEQALRSLQKCLKHQPDFVAALKLVVPMLEGDDARNQEADALRRRIRRIENSFRPAAPRYRMPSQ